MQNRKKLIFVYVGIAVFFSILAVVMSALYFITFHGELSTNLSDWDAFGSYFSVIVAIINLVFFIIITIYVAQIQDKSLNQQLLQDRELHIQDYKWKRLEELNSIVTNLLSIAIGNINSESIKKLYYESCKLSRSIDLYIANNSMLFPDIDFKTSAKATNTFNDYVIEIKDNKSFSPEIIRNLNQLMADMDKSLSDLTVNIQNNLLNKK